MKKSRKPLIIGIIAAALALLALLLAVVLIGCLGQSSGAEDTTAPVQTEPQLQTYDLYWNIDRALYDGKSEAGMSSRMPEDDGFFRVRFFKDGTVVELKVADRRVVNAIEVNDLMGLQFDENGIVVGVVNVDDLPCQKIGWQFYVQSAGGNLIKLNSSVAGSGIEILLETDENTGIWDMTGLSGEVGCEAEPVTMDRVLAIGDNTGKVIHVFIYSRENYMRTFEAECTHCGKTVTWNEWTRDKYLPLTGGHYKLMNDVQAIAQSSMAEDAKICLDLNGKRIDGKTNTRVYSLHNPGTELAIMDTSEGKTGTIAAHGKAGQGLCVWVRYGVAYLYDGILDASDATSTSNGVAVNVAANAYMYMYGGEIIGGTSTYTYNEETGKYGAGLGGSLFVGGKFVMHDGVIRDGHAQSKVTAWNADGSPKTYQRGLGGNVFVSGGAVFEMNGGTIKNGRSDNSGGNFYLDGTAEFIMNGGVITGGRTLGKSRTGGNIIGYSKVSVTVNGGTIENGIATYRGGNIYTTGRLDVCGGEIRGGKLRNYKTGKDLEDQSSRNVFHADNTMAMYGGYIDGGVQVTDSNATKNPSRLVLSGYATINSKTAPNLTISTGGGGVKVKVGKLYDRAMIGVTTAAGIFSEPTDEANLDNFYSEIEGADIQYVDGRLGLGRFSCLCGSNSEHVSDHLGDCKEAGIQTLFWGPITGTKLPTTTGNYYLLNDLACAAQTSLAENADVKLDLNGYTITGPENFRTISVHNPGASLVICDSSEGKTGVVRSHGVGASQGNVVWTRYGSFDFYGGTLDGSAYNHSDAWNEGKDGIFGTADDTSAARDGGAVCMGSGTTIRMYGGTIIGNTAVARTQTKTVTDEDGTTREASYTTTAPGGASLYVPAKSTFEMYAGTIRDGISEDYGGNVLLGGTMIIHGGTVENGTCTFNGGNINTKDGSHLELHSGAITGGWGKNVTGNLHVSGTFIMTGGSVTGGKVGKTASTTSPHADIQFVNGDMTYTGGKLGNIQLTNSNTSGTEGGCVVNLSGKLDIAAIKLTTYDSKPEDEKIPTMPILEIGGALQPVKAIPVTPADAAADFAVGKDYALTAADAAAFVLSESTVTAASDTATNSLFFGRMACLCGKESHTKGCLDLWGGAQKRWTPWTSTDSLPVSGGNYYLTAPVTLKSGVQNLKENANVVLDLNGYTVTGKANNRMYATFGTGSNLTITDNSAAQTGKLVGNGTAFDGVKSCCIWVRYGTFTLLGGTLDGSQAELHNGWESNKVAEKNGGVICLEKNRTFNMYGGTVIGAKAVKTTIDGNALYAPMGASVYLPSGSTMNMHAGTVKNGNTEKNGGNLYIYGGTLNMHGGTIESGEADDCGGNLFVRGGTVNMDGGVIKNGTRNGSAANLTANFAFTNGGTLNMTGGEIHGRLNLGTTVASSDTRTGTVNISGSAKVYYPSAADPVSSNNISATLTINVGKLNDDALIGFQVSASTSKPLTSDATNPKQLATFTDEESLQKALDEGRIGISVYIANDTHNRTYAFVVKDGKLSAYQASATAK